MFKIFEWIGSIVAIAALIQIASDPKGALDDIARGPAPRLAEFNDKLMGMGKYKHKKHKFDPSKPLSASSLEQTNH